MRLSTHVAINDPSRGSRGKSHTLESNSSSRKVSRFNRSVPPNAYCIFDISLVSKHRPCMKL